MWRGDRPITAVPPPASSRFHFISPWMLARGGWGIKKSSFILKNGLAPSCTELEAERLKSWQRRGEGDRSPGGLGLGRITLVPARIWSRSGDSGLRHPSPQKGSKSTWSKGHSGDTGMRE